MGFRGHYFGSGPSPLPAEVARRFADKYCQVGDLSLRTYELAHIHPVSKNHLDDLVCKLRRLLSISNDHEVLLVSGGARHQYEQMALNFKQNLSFRILESGIFSKNWADVLAQSCESVQRDVLDLQRSYQSQLIECTANELMCVVSNETANGVMLPLDMQCNRIVTDATSDLGFRQLDINHYAMVFAALGKAFFAAGMSIVIIRKDMFAHCQMDLLPLQSYATLLDSGSLYATPAMLCLDMLDCVVDWMLSQGGMVVLAACLLKRSKQIYDILDACPAYQTQVPMQYRSIQNICFQLRERDVSDFIRCAEMASLYGLSGHRAVGGIRINLYHGVSEQAFTALCDFLVAYGYGHFNTMEGKCSRMFQS